MTDLSQIEREQLFQVAREGVVPGRKLINKSAACRLYEAGLIKAARPKHNEWCLTPLGEIRTAAEVARAREAGSEVGWWRE